MSALVEQDPGAALALFTGTVGVAIALYLAFVTTRDVPWRYTAGFFLFGSGLALANTSPVAPAAFANGLRLVVLSLVLVGELYGFVWVIRHTAAENPVEAAKSFRAGIRR